MIGCPNPSGLGKDNCFNLFCARRTATTLRVLVCPYLFRQVLGAEGGCDLTAIYVKNFACGACVHTCAELSRTGVDTCPARYYSPLERGAPKQNSFALGRGVFVGGRRPRLPLRSWQSAPQLAVGKYMPVPFCRNRKGFDLQPIFLLSR